MYEFHLGKEKAEKYVLALCGRLSISVDGRGSLRKETTVQAGTQFIKIDFPREVDSAMKTGRANILQTLHDSADRYLNTPVSMGTISAGYKSGIKVASTYGSHTSSLDGSGYIEAPEVSFSDELALYRRQAIESFNSRDLIGFCRNYRAFLQSSVSLVECVLHRYTFHVRQIVPSMASYENTAVLDSRVGLDVRLDAWMQTFAAHKNEDFKQSATRSKFIELKEQRNQIVHPSSPTIGYSVKSVVKYMNFAQAGVGGLLHDLRQYSGDSPLIGFIQHIRTLPEIRLSASA
jgi:hypothetical protein